MTGICTLHVCTYLAHWADLHVHAWLAVIANQDDG